MVDRFSSTIRQSYIDLRSIYIGADALKDEQLEFGRVTVLLADDDTFSAEGTLNSQGLLSGMAKLYAKLDLKDGTEVSFSVEGGGTLLIHAPTPPATSATEELDPGASGRPKSVFQKQNLRHIHIEPFRPENLDNWEPETETDVYLAFGVLQEYTDFQYCCGASKSLLAKLGASYEESSKPDAILIDRTTDEYLIAEWKKFSSDFKQNHAPEDVDVLVCWHDDEKDSQKLPRRVLALHAVARKAVETTLKE